MENVMIDLTNWEEYLLLRLDGELSEAEEAALDAFLAAHPALAGEVATYEATVLAPEEDVLFEGKEALYKPVPQHFNFRPVMWAAAAVLLIALGVKLVPEKNPAALVVLPKKEIQTPAQPASLPAEHTGVPVPPSPKAPAHIATVAKQKRPLPVQEITASRKEKAARPEPPAGMVALAAQADRALAVENKLPPEMQLQFVEIGKIAAAPPEKNLQFSVDLPLLSTLKQAAKTGFPQIQNAREKLQGTETTVMLFDRKLFTIHL